MLKTLPTRFEVKCGNFMIYEGYCRVTAQRYLGREGFQVLEIQGHKGQIENTISKFGEESDEWVDVQLYW